MKSPEIQNSATKVMRNEEHADISENKENHQNQINSREIIRTEKM